jgi:hypothetical protein
MTLALHNVVFSTRNVGKLQLRQEGKVMRHELDGRPVEPNSLLELRLRNDQWISGQYQWSGVTARWPGLRVELGGEWDAREGNAPAAVLALHPEAELRWPPR